jgi:predicted HicB family RNase H-like nuclease
MKIEQKSNCVIRVSSQLHRQAKAAAAREGASLTSMVEKALEREIARREARERRRLAAMG